MTLSGHESPRGDAEEPIDRTKALPAESGSTPDASARPLSAAGSDPGEPAGDTDDPLVGTVVAGRYEIVSRLGQGGMGTVYRAHQLGMERDVALKLMNPELLDDPKAATRFEREMRCAAQRNHPNIVTIYDFGKTDDGRFFLAMEFLEGETLRELIDRETQLDPLRASRIVRQVLEALTAVHDEGIVHRDIKPANLMVCRLRGSRDWVKLLDFGIARRADRDRDEPALTVTHGVIGSLRYMSPEQASGEDVDARSDLYSVGVLFFETLTGRPLHRCRDPKEELLRALASLSQRDTIADFVLSLLARHPDDRPPSAEVAHARLEELTAGETDATGESAESVSADPTIALDTPRGIPRSSSSGTRETRLDDETASALRELQRFRFGVRALLGLVFVGLLGGAALWWGWFDPFGPKGPGGDIASAGPHGEPIVVGIVHSLSGTLAASESPVVDATLLAIEEINAKGGVLGRPLVPIVSDGKSEEAIFAFEAEKLIDNENAAVLFGGWTSASRKAMRPVVEKADRLLFYPVQFEGLESSPRIIYLGATANQQLVPGVRWSFAFHGARKFFLVGSDYIFPRAAHEILRDEIEQLGGEVVGEAFVPLGETELDRVLEAMVDAKPDVILSTLNGDTNVSFFRGLPRHGIDPHRTPTVSFSIAEQELRSLDAAAIAGSYAVWTYFQTLDLPENHRFVTNFRTRYGSRRVTTDPMVAAYNGVHIWARAVERCGSLETKAVRGALADSDFDGPAGRVRLDGDTGYTWHVGRVGQISDAGELSEIWNTGVASAPEPYPATRSREAWEQLLRSLHDRWGGWTPKASRFPERMADEK